MTKIEPVTLKELLDQRIFPYLTHVENHNIEILRNGFLKELLE